MLWSDVVILIVAFGTGNSTVYRALSNNFFIVAKEICVKVFQMNTKKSRPFQPLEDSEIMCPSIPHLGGHEGGRFPGPCGIFIGCTVNGFMFGVGILCGSEGSSPCNLTFLVPRKRESEFSHFFLNSVSPPGSVCEINNAANNQNNEKMT